MSAQLLNALEKWKLDAKLEDSDRLFYHVAAADKLAGGQKYFLVGRKGTGKTAIAEHLYRLSDARTFTHKLSFKNFPFNELYALHNDKFRSPNQYITLWKFIIYATIAKLAIPNERVDAKVRSILDQAFGGDPADKLPALISRWTSAEFNLQVLGSGLDRTKTREIIENKASWVERVDVLEQLLLTHIDDSRYILLFDELDEDYKLIADERDRYEQYYALLTSLFKAIQDVHSVFSGPAYNILPILFIRDDIFTFVRDPDRTKWTDYIYDLDWDEASIKELLAFRISRSINHGERILPFHEAWPQLFSAGLVHYGHHQSNRASVFDYMTRSTHVRPRDYVRYLKVCAEKALAKGEDKITPTTVVQTDKAFSNYLRSEIEDEMGGLMTEASEILDIISDIGKQTLTVQEFVSAYNGEVKSGALPKRRPEFVLAALFHFSVIGNQPRQINKQIFRYMNRDARLSLKGSLCVHRGLFKSLQIV